jgi:hypothetical protein
MATTATVSIVPRMTETLETTAERAYFKAEKRGFEPGHEEADWLEVEQEVKKLSDHWLP